MARRDQQRQYGMVRTALVTVVVLAIAVAMLAGCSHTLVPTTIVVGPRRELLVRGRVNGTAVLLQLDTGSSTTLLTPATCRRLGLDRRRGSWAGVVTPPVGGGTGGNYNDLTWVMLRKLSFAGAVFHAQAAVMLDLYAAEGAAGGAARGAAREAIDGLLGMDVLGQYVVDVDLGSHRFAIHRDGDVRVPAELVVADYKALAGGQITLAITIDGRPATAVLDLGASRTFANTRVALTPDDAETTISAVVSSDRHAMTFRAASDVRIQLGALPLQARSVWISDLPIFRTFGLADRPAVILGTDVLAGRRIIIDPFLQRVYLSR
jgi:Aspartyl protease